MNVLFLTTGTMKNLEQHSIYPDLLRCFRNYGHNVFCVSSYEKRTGKETELVEDKGAHILHVKIGNLTKTNTLEKGISTVMIEKQYMNAIKRYLPNVRFDLVMYSTPPITLVKVIEYIKKRDNCKSYLLLKDIFPQNAVDLEMMRKSGLKGLLYKYFRNKEKRLYAVSDYVGCMSQANVEYVIKHNPEVDRNIVEVCPNCVDVIDMSVDAKKRQEIRKKYGIPLDKKIFVYGGNLGKPQGIDFMIDCLKNQINNNKVYFLIVGDGTEFHKIERFVNTDKPSNIKLMKRLPKDDYDAMVGACDIGMIFLDHRFTIPNFPSRLLAYLQAKLPVLAVTDPNTDIGRVIVDGGFGWWCESNNVATFEKMINDIINLDISVFKENGFLFLTDQYSSDRGYQTIINHFE